MIVGSMMYERRDKREDAKDSWTVKDMGMDARYWDIKALIYLDISTLCCVRTENA